MDSNKYLESDSDSDSDYSSDGDIDIHEIVRLGSFQELKEAIAKDRPRLIALKDPFGRIALHYAAALNKIKETVFLIVKQSNVNAQDNSEQTCLHLAAAKGYTEMCRNLLEFKANITLRDKDCWTALHFAVDARFLETATLLVKRGANLNAEDHRYGRTPLHIAAEYGYSEMVTMLLVRGANISASGDEFYSRTPLHLASMHGHVDVVRILVRRGADVSLLSGFLDKNPLHLACENGHEECVKVLCHAPDQHIELDATGVHINGSTPLHICAQLSHLTIMNMLLDLGAGINKLGRFTTVGTPLHIACQHDQAHAASELIKRGADINARDDTAHTPLHVACREGSYTCAFMLIDLDADVDAMADNKRTPLDYVKVPTLKEKLRLAGEAATAKRIALEEAEKERQHMLAERRDRGNEAKERQLMHTEELRVRAAVRRVDFLRALRAIADVSGELSGLCALAELYPEQDINENIMDVELLPAEEVELPETGTVVSRISYNSRHSFRSLQSNNTNNSWGSYVPDEIKSTSALPRAALRGFQDVVHALLRWPGLNINLQDSRGNSALHNAAWRGHRDIVEELLLSGAKVGLINKDGKVPANLAATNFLRELVRNPSLIKDRLKYQDKVSDQLFLQMAVREGVGAGGAGITVKQAACADSLIPYVPSPHPSTVSFNASSNHSKRNELQALDRLSMGEEEEEEEEEGGGEGRENTNRYEGKLYRANLQRPPRRFVNPHVSEERAARFDAIGTAIAEKLSRDAEMAGRRSINSINNSPPQQASSRRGMHKLSLAATNSTSNPSTMTAAISGPGPNRQKLVGGSILRSGSAPTLLAMPMNPSPQPQPQVIVVAQDAIPPGGVDELLSNIAASVMSSDSIANYENEAEQQQQEEDGEVAAIRDKAMSQLHPTVAAQVSSVLQQRRLAASRGVASSIEAAVASATMSASLTLPPSSSKYGPVPGSFGGSTADFFFLDSATSSTHTNSNNNNNNNIVGDTQSTSSSSPSKGLFLDLLTLQRSYVPTSFDTVEEWNDIKDFLWLLAYPYRRGGNGGGASATAVGAAGGGGGIAASGDVEDDEEEEDDGDAQGSLASGQQLSLTASEHLPSTAPAGGSADGDSSLDRRMYLYHIALVMDNIQKTFTATTAKQKPTDRLKYHPIPGANNNDASYTLPPVSVPQAVVMPKLLNNRDSSQTTSSINPLRVLSSQHIVANARREVQTAAAAAAAAAGATTTGGDAGRNEGGDDMSSMAGGLGGGGGGGGGFGLASPAHSVMGDSTADIDLSSLDLERVPSNISLPDVKRLIRFSQQCEAFVQAVLQLYELKEYTWAQLKEYNEYVHHMEHYGEYVASDRKTFTSSSSKEEEAAAAEHTAERGKAAVAAAVQEGEEEGSGEAGVAAEEQKSSNSSHSSASVGRDPSSDKNKDTEHDVGNPVHTMKSNIAFLVQYGVITADIQKHLLDLTDLGFTACFLNRYDSNGRQNNKNTKIEQLLVGGDLEADGGEDDGGSGSSETAGDRASSRKFTARLKALQRTRRLPDLFANPPRYWRLAVDAMFEVADVIKLQVERGYPIDTVRAHLWTHAGRSVIEHQRLSLRKQHTQQMQDLQEIVATGGGNGGGNGGGSGGGGNAIENRDPDGVLSSELVKPRSLAPLAEGIPLPNASASASGCTANVKAYDPVSAVTTAVTTASALAEEVRHRRVAACRLWLSELLLLEYEEYFAEQGFRSLVDFEGLLEQDCLDYFPFLKTGDHRRLVKYVAQLNEVTIAGYEARV